MTESDTLKHAINPLTDSPVPENECINQVRISRCLFYVSDVLRKLIENGGAAEKPVKTEKRMFSISREELKGYIFDENPIPVSKIASKLNGLVDTDAMTKLSHRSITSFLLNGGYLRMQESVSGKTSKVPTELGRRIGISMEERQGSNRLYYVTVYNKDAQRFILDNMDAIIELANM